MPTAEQQPNLPDLLTALAVLARLRNRVSGQETDIRKQAQQLLIEQWATDGPSRFDVRAPGGGEKIANASLVIPTPETVIDDEDAFADYVQGSAPTEVETAVTVTVHLGQFGAAAALADLLAFLESTGGALVGKTTRKVRPAYATALLDEKNIIKIDDDGTPHVVNRATGEVEPVPGVRIETKPPSKFSVNRVNAERVDEIIDALLCDPRQAIALTTYGQITAPDDAGTAAVLGEVIDTATERSAPERDLVGAAAQ